MMPVWIAAVAAIVLLGLIVMIGARGRPEDAARDRRRSRDEGGSSGAFDGSAGGNSCGADAGGGDCGGGGD
jgi:uncharacterized membrane protein YgcG